MKYTVLLPPPAWSVEFDTFKETVAWMKAASDRGEVYVGPFGPEYDGPEDKSRGLTPGEIETLEENF